jgi:hypothetical protein
MSSLPSSHASCATLCYSLYKCRVLLSGALPTRQLLKQFARRQARQFYITRLPTTDPNSCALSSATYPTIFHPSISSTPNDHRQIASSRIESSSRIYPSNTTDHVNEELGQPVEGYMILGSNICPTSTAPPAISPKTHFQFYISRAVATV